jgi:hypothetical protein
MEKEKKNGSNENSAMVEYKPGTAFPGRLGRAIGGSSPAWPAPLRAKEGAPNVLFIVLKPDRLGQREQVLQQRARRSEAEPRGAQ